MSVTNEPNVLSVIIHNVVVQNVVMPNVVAPFYLPSAGWNKTGLHHPQDGVTNPKNKLLHFLTTFFLQNEKGTSF